MVPTRRPLRKVGVEKSGGGCAKSGGGIARPHTAPVSRSALVNVGIPTPSPPPAAPARRPAP